MFLSLLAFSFHYDQLTDANRSLGSPWPLKVLEKHYGSYECCEINVHRIQICIVVWLYAKCIIILKFPAMMVIVSS